jgi:3-hydroxymyristoyl/3-hydroxydecanoyl-(acyl carrier protein) dehydratase
VTLPSDIVVERQVATDHPAFTGHFPGAPVLPGACVLALVLQAAAEQPELNATLGTRIAVPQVKFLAPVGPGQHLVIHLRPAAGALGFDVRRGGTTIARGQLAPAG